MTFWEKAIDFVANGLASRALKKRGAERTFTVSQHFAAGEANELDMSEWVDRYKKVCEAAVADPSLEASDLDGDGYNETKCNWGLQRIFGNLGYSRFSGMRANEIMTFAEREEDWREDYWDRCIEEIKGGSIAFAGWFNPGGPGHVAALYPGPAVYSGKLGKIVPFCANVGRDNGIIGVNYAFSLEPRYFWHQGPKTRGSL